MESANAIYVGSSIKTPIDPKTERKNQAKAKTTSPNNNSKLGICKSKRKPPKKSSANSSSEVVLMQDQGTVARLKSKSPTVASGSGDVEKGKKAGTVLKNVREFGIIDGLVMIQIILACILLFSSLSLAAVGSSISWSIFFGAILIIIPLLPVLAYLSVGSVRAPIVFKVVFHCSAFINIFWAIISWLINSSAFPGTFLLLVIALIQYTCILIVSLDEYLEKREQANQTAQSTKSDSDNQESRGTKKIKMTRSKTLFTLEPC